MSLFTFNNFYCVGRYGIRHYTQTNLYKAWGRTGVALSLLLPVLGFYQFFKVSLFTGNMFIDRAIL